MRIINISSLNNSMITSLYSHKMFSEDCIHGNRGVKKFYSPTVMLCMQASNKAEILRHWRPTHSFSTSVEGTTRWLSWKEKAGISGSSTGIRKEWWFVTVGISCLLTGAVKRPSQLSAGVGGAAGCTGPSVELPVWWSPSVDSSQSISSIINTMAQTLIGVWPVCTLLVFSFKIRVRW